MTTPLITSPVLTDDGAILPHGPGHGIAGDSLSPISNPINFTTTLTPKEVVVGSALGGIDQMNPAGSVGNVISIGTTWQIVGPSGDVTGATDTLNIQNAVNNAQYVLLLPGNYTTNATITVPWNTILLGCGVRTQISFKGTGDCFVMSNPTIASGNFSTQQDQSGGFRDILIGGGSAGAGSTGIHIGNGLGYTLINVFIRNFNKAGSIGLFIENSIWWTEKMQAQVQVSNCTTCYRFGVSGTGTISFEYNKLDLVAYWIDGQTAFDCENGAFFGGCELYWRGNAKGGAAAPGPFLTMGGGVLFRGSLIVFRPENNTPIAFGAPVTINDAGGGTNHFLDCIGLMDFGANAWSPSNLTAGKLSFGGSIQGDAALANAKTSVTKPTVTTPAVPAASTNFTNPFGCDCMVYVSNTGTGVSISVNGGTTLQSSGLIYLPANGVINLGAYTVAPTWAWHAGSTW